MDTGVLGRLYRDGDVIVRKGDVGECMYVVLDGQVEVFQASEGREVRLALLGEGDVFGEMALFENEVRSASARALGDVRLLTVDKATFLRRVHEDPSLALQILRKISHRLRRANAELVTLKSEKA